MIGRFPTLISLLIFSLLLSFPTAAAEEWVCVSSEQPGFHIQDVAVSGDGAFRAITGDGGVILLTPAGRELWRSPDGRYRSVALSGDGDILVAGGDGLLVRHKNGTVLATVPSRYFVNGVAVNADGSRIAAVFEDETLRLYNATGVLLETTDTGDDLVSVAISPEGTYIAGGTDTGNVVFYSDTGEERWTYRLSSQPVTSLAMAEGGRTIAAVSEDGAAILLSGQAAFSGQGLRRIREVLQSRQTVPLVLLRTCRTSGLWTGTAPMSAELRRQLPRFPLQWMTQVLM